MLVFKYKPISNKRQIGRVRSKSDIKFLVIHYTGNYSPGATAEAHYRYLQGALRYGSAHYFVDDKQIIQVIGDTLEAWSVGDNQGRGHALNGCTNYNSISIEMCVNSDGNFDMTYFNTVELVKELKRQYPNAKVCRHYDVTTKNCPAFMVSNVLKWKKFLNDITLPRALEIDISKDSTAKVIGTSNLKQSNANTFETAGHWDYSKGYWSFIEDSGKTRTGWLKYNGSWFYLDNKGKMVTGWLEYNNAWYFFNDNGYMVTGWLTYNKNKFYFAYSGKMVTGKQTIDGKEYIFNDQGYFIK